MTRSPALTPRDSTRSRLVEVAARLLATQGPEAVTTRSVALAAGVQAPAIYRLFGDKDGLLEAVAQHGFDTYLARKPPVDDSDDPVVGLRAGWDLHVGFGVENPALFRLMNTVPPSAEGHRAAESGIAILRRRMHRVARSGRLRVDEERAVELVRAAGTGVVFTLIDRSDDAPDDALSDLAWESVCRTILVDAPAAGPVGPRAAAVTLTAVLPDLPGFSPNERALLAEWLGRVAESPEPPAPQPDPGGPSR